MSEGHEMIYPHNFEQKLGFDGIRTLIKGQCLSELGKEQTDKMMFSAHYEEVQEQLTQTDEFGRVLSGDKDFPVQHFYDLREELRRIKIIGTWLDESELFNLARSLETMGTIVRFFELAEPELYPALKRLASEATVFPEIARRIAEILNKFGRLKDNASAELARIRREMTNVQASVSRSLNAILRTAQAEGFVDKDTAPAVRDGRLVIPVNPAFKRKIKGIVHDESASGKTVFIEPAEVVEANNRYRELEAEERREIVRILTQITDFIRPQADELLDAFDFLGKIDFIRAKALFAQTLGAIKPAVQDHCLIDWANALHPLLLLSHRKQGKPVVPLNIELNGSQRILLISGPNAGGKSVCLKTVGLLQYMLQCGLLVPMHESSQTGIFERLFIDIGDEQSIENDLSTYSSHLTNMKFFIRNSQEHTLLLIDEFGAGTEPHIGGAIAEAALHRFNENRAFGIITTHYTNLKHFAEATAGIVNGAMLYDRHLMQPLFQLQVGNPGSSFAIEIARKIGLPEEVIAYATDKVGSDYVDFDKHLQDIVRDKRYWETKRQTVRLKEKQLDELTERYKADLQTVESQRKELLRQARSEAQQLLAQTNAQIENTIRKIKESQAEKESTRQARADLEAFRQEKIEAERQRDDLISRKIRQLQEREERKKQRKKQAVSPTLTPAKEEPLHTGDSVKLKGQTGIGQIMELTEKTAVVALGNLKTTVKLKDLERVSHNQARKSERQVSLLSSETNDELRKRRLLFKQEIDLRGMRADEALQAVMYFIDDALMFGVERVRILHGTGTGALRQIVRDYLVGISGIRRFQDEHVQMGGAGITVVEF